jgi:hypothetical protein
MHIHLYSGPADGARLRLRRDVRYLFIRGTTYTHCAEWSARFRRPTFIPTYFKGAPRRQGKVENGR